jgi:hypothetical protein
MARYIHVPAAMLQIVCLPEAANFSGGHAIIMKSWPRFLTTCWSQKAQIIQAGQAFSKQDEQLFPHPCPVDEKQTISNTAC